MTDAPVKTRFAPSPTGWLHLGNMRTALFSALLTRSFRGQFLLRIEDTDRERSVTEYVQGLEEDLLWLGLDWDEGPGRPGAHGPYFQSRRDEIYQHYFAHLEHGGRAYPCFCSSRELELSRKTQLSAGRPPRYAGTCARLTREQIEQRLAQGLQPTLRFRVCDDEEIVFQDLVRGEQRFATADIGDFIIRRADGSAAFFFCNAIDDALMGVTHVLRGEDHLANTPRQLLILQALGLRVPAYGHISMIVGDDGAPLSKRHGSRSIRELRAEGYLPLAVVNYLARLGHHYDSGDLMTAEQLAQAFAVERLGRAPAHFDPAQLRHWQQLAVAQADVAQLWDWMGAEVQARVPADQREAFIDTVRHNVVLPGDALRWARIVYANPLTVEEDAQAVIAHTDPGFFQSTLTALDSVGIEFKPLTQHIKNSTGASGKALFHPLRAALTGTLDGPELGRLLPLIGVERARLRLASLIAGDLLPTP